MLHHVPTTQAGPRGPDMAGAIQTCVHCGFCLPVCPTYQELGQEMDSPRGRIILMKEVLEGDLKLEDAQLHIDRCLGCLACEPACPSGVPYRDLISPFRAHFESQRRRSLLDRVQRFAIGQTLPYPKRFAFAARLAKLAKAFKSILPKRSRAMLDLVPVSLPKSEPLKAHYPAIGEKRGRVALLAGCAQRVLEPAINAATIEVLTGNGVEVVIPQSQVCCGALAWHIGDLKSAQAKARANIAAFPEDVDAILTNAAGCGSGLHEYGIILKGTELEKDAEAFAHRVQDVSVYLQKLGLSQTPKLNKPTKVAYQDACHLKNAQGVSAEPRALLSQVENLELVEIPDGALCCGSAGTYNIDQPDIAADLGRRKVEAISKTGAEVVLSGNIGCMTQMKLHARQTGATFQVRHTMELLAEALR